MSITRGDNDNKDQNKSGASSEGGVFGKSFNQTGSSQSAGDAQQPRSGSSRLGGGVHGTSRLNGLRTGMSRKRPAADLQKMLVTFNEEFASFTNANVMVEAQNFKLVMVDRARLGKKVDLLLALLPVVVEGKTHVAIHTLLIEDSNDQYEPVTLQVAGRQLRYSTVVGDVYTADLWSTIVAIVSEQSGLSVIPYDAGHQSLPAEMDITDKDAIHKIAFFASEALTRLALNAIVQTTSDIVSLSDLGENTVATATIDFRSVNDQTAAGLPLRSDFSVKLRYSDVTKTGESQTEKAFDLGSSIPLGGAEGFIDLSYRAPASPGFGQQQATQCYWARAVLTRLDTDQDFITPELQLLSLMGATLISRNLNWARTWSQQFRGLDAGLHDIGAIGFELAYMGNEPMRIDTQSTAFDDNALGRLVMTAIHEKPLISIDVEESGELSWLNRVLLDAAEGSSDAQSSLIASADNLTNGRLGSRWQGGDIVVDDGNRIHLGYYTAPDGVTKRDIRELDYLEVLNRYAETDPQMIEMWQATFDNLEIDAEVRLAQREDLIRKMLGATVHITGYARRLTFAPDFLDMLLEAGGEAGLKIRPENTLIGFGQSAARGRADLSTLAYGGAGARQVFSYGGTGGGRGFSRPYTGRGSFNR